MRIVPVMILLAISAFAQNDRSAMLAACGPQDTTFDVKLDKSQHTPEQPEPGKARVYFIQDAGITNCIGGCGTMKVGMDGAWLGAIQQNSYFSMSVEPGEHHVCVSPQTRFQAKRLVGLAHFTAETGKSYYFRARFFDNDKQWLLDFDPIDSDQGKFLVASYSLSVSHPKP